MTHTKFAPDATDARIGELIKQARTKLQNFLKSRLLGFMTNWTAHAKREKLQTARRTAPH